MFVILLKRLMVIETVICRSSFLCSWYPLNWHHFIWQSLLIGLTSVTAILDHGGFICSPSWNRFFLDLKFSHLTLQIQVNLEYTIELTFYCNRERFVCKYFILSQDTLLYCLVSNSFQFCKDCCKNLMI